MIFRNRRDFIASIGTRDWWKKVDKTSQRRKPVVSLSLGHDELNALNDYFGDLCIDHAYIKPTPLEISEDQEVPEISERQVLNSFFKRIKKTATGPDGIRTLYRKTTPSYSVQLSPGFGICLLEHTPGLSLGKSQT